MKQQKLEARERMGQILAAALKLAKSHGYQRITRDAIAVEAGVSEALVTYHLGTMPELRRSVIREAVRVECLPVIAQGVVSRDRRALKIPDDLKNRALESLRA